MATMLEQNEADRPDAAQADALAFVKEGDKEGGFVADMVPEVATSLSWGILESRQHVEDEIDLMFRAARGFWDMFPDQVMRMCAAMSARCSELYVHLHRLEGRREWKQIRTQQVEILLAELDRQFKIASRLVEVQKFEAFQEGRQT